MHIALYHVQGILWRKSHGLPGVTEIGNAMFTNTFQIESTTFTKTFPNNLTLQQNNKKDF